MKQASLNRFKLLAHHRLPCFCLRLSQALIHCNRFRGIKHYYLQSSWKLSDVSTFQNPTTILAFRKTNFFAHPSLLLFSNFTLFFYSMHHIYEQFLIHAPHISSYFTKSSLFSQQAFDIKKQLFANLSQSLMNLTHFTLHLFQDRNLNLDSMIFLRDFIISQSPQHSIFFFSRLHLEHFVAWLSTTISQIIFSGHIDIFSSCITMHTNLIYTCSVYNLVFWPIFTHIFGRPTSSETLFLLLEVFSICGLRAHILQMPYADSQCFMDFP